MAFENLSNKLQDVFKQLRGKGKLTEAYVKTAMREVKISLLEADLNFKIVKLHQDCYGTGCWHRGAGRPESGTAGD